MYIYKIKQDKTKLEYLINITLFKKKNLYYFKNLKFYYI